MTFHLMDPELEELLHTVAADPRSSLLRVDRPTLLRGYFDRDPMVRESCTQLTSAERQLLRVHRRELGEMLRSACFALLNEPDNHLHVYCLDQGSGHLEPTSPPDLTDPNCPILIQSVGEHRARKIVRAARGTRTPLQLATLACRVAPNVATYLYLSDAYEADGHAGHASRALDFAESLTSCQVDSAHVASYQAFQLAAETRYRCSADAYRTCWELTGGWPNEVLSWLCLAVQSQSENRFSEACQALEAASVSAETLREWTGNQLLLKRQGHWKPQDASKTFWIARANRAGGDATYVLESLFTD